MLRVMLGTLFVVGLALIVVAVIALFKKLTGGKGRLEILGIKLEGQGAPIIFLLVGAALLLLTVRGAEAADARLEDRLRSAAGQEVETTRAEEAPAYAPEAFQSVVDASANLDRELAAQKSTFPFLRSYGRAENLARDARVTAETARATTIEKKQEVKEAATLDLEVARAALADAERAGRTQAAASLRSSIAGVETAIGAGRFLEARRVSSEALRRITPVERGAAILVPSRPTGGPL